MGCWVRVECRADALPRIGRKTGLLDTSDELDLGAFNFLLM